MLYSFQPALTNSYEKKRNKTMKVTSRALLRAVQER